MSNLAADPQVIALYLNSDLAVKVTGVTIPVDAGHLILTGVNPQPVRWPERARGRPAPGRASAAGRVAGTRRSP